MWRQSWDNDAQFPTLFEDLPPETLVSLKMNKKVAINYDELQRAKWFWARRPRRISCIQNAAMVLVLCAVFYVIAFQQIIAEAFNGVILSAVCASLVVIFTHICRYAQWKSEYRSAILRILPEEWY
jgi:hypothetical protein